MIAIGQLFEGAVIRPQLVGDGAPVQAAGLRAPVIPNIVHFARMTELLLDHFGEGWLTGGSIDVRYVAPLHAGEALTARARVMAIEPDGQHIRVSLDVWCENQAGDDLARGTAQCLAPRPASI